MEAEKCFLPRLQKQLPLYPHFPCGLVNYLVNLPSTSKDQITMRAELTGVIAN